MVVAVIEPVLILVALNAPVLMIPVVTVPVKVGDAIGAAPKLVNAAAAVVASVPPLAMATVPVRLPAVTVDETAGIFNVVPDKVAAPVPVVVNVIGA